MAALIYGAIALLLRLRPPSSFGRLGSWVILSENFILFTLIGTLGTVSSYVAMTLSDGFADELLARSDAMLGFDWPAIQAAVISRHWLLLMLDRAYASFVWMPLLVFALLHRGRQFERMHRFIAAYGLSLGITVIVFYFFPARAAFEYYQGAGVGLPSHARQYGQAIAGLRDGSLTQLHLGQLSGIVTFPSFHATMAILYVWAAWPATRRLRVPLLVVNSLMWIAAVPIGGHYAIDLFGGSVIAVAAVVVAGRIGSPKISPADAQLRSSIVAG